MGLDLVPAGHDTKLIAVPNDNGFKGYAHIRAIDDAPQHWRDRIAHFCEHYKDPEAGKWVKIAGWGNADAAREEILGSVARYQQAPDKPKF